MNNSFTQNIYFRLYIDMNSKALIFSSSVYFRASTCLLSMVFSVESILSMQLTVKQLHKHQVGCSSQDEIQHLISSTSDTDVNILHVLI